MSASLKADGKPSFLDGNLNHSCEKVNRTSLSHIMRKQEFCIDENLGSGWMLNLHVLAA